MIMHTFAVFCGGCFSGGLTTSADATCRICIKCHHGRSVWSALQEVPRIKLPWFHAPHALPSWGGYAGNECSGGTAGRDWICLGRALAKSKELFTLLDLCVSSLRRGHANLLCIVPILTDDPRRESVNSCAAARECRAALCAPPPPGRFVVAAAVYLIQTWVWDGHMHMRCDAVLKYALGAHGRPVSGPKSKNSPPRSCPEAVHPERLGLSSPREYVSTVAIMAQGTRRAVAVTQAFCFFGLGSSPGGDQPPPMSLKPRFGLEIKTSSPNSRSHAGVPPKSFGMQLRRLRLDPLQRSSEHTPGTN